jgi:virulence factor Mce-like protein
MRGRTGGALTASPVLVGAVTLLVTIVAVFLSYNANTGLPFVPTYDLKANLPNASQLVEGFEVRIGGARVGQISKIEPKRREDGSTYAQVTMKLDKEIEPLPADSTLLVRPRSALGLKYLELTPGSGRAGFPAGSTIPIRQARPEVVELDDLFNMFDDKARAGSRNSLDGFGTGLAGRGADLNLAIAGLRPLLEDLEPVAANLAAPQTRLDRFFRSLADAAREVAPVADQQAAMFANLDTTFTALASIARPFLQETITEGVRSEEVAIRDFPTQRPFLRNNAAFFRELRPGVATLPRSAPILASAFKAGTDVLPKTPPVNRELGDVFEALADFSDDPLVRGGVDQLTRLSSSLRPTVNFLAPVQTTCNYATLFFRNVASLLSEGDSNGTWQRFMIVPSTTSSPDPDAGVAGPNNEGGPSAAPSDGPTTANHLHQNPYPNTASPGQTRECEAGNERYSQTVGRTLVGNQSGNQGTRTSGQRGSSSASAGVTR